jgi:hypothetical protein
MLSCAIILNLASLCTFATGQNWTVGTDGKGRWFYGQYSQLGSRGFFGPYNVDLSATGDFASINGWMGVQNYQNPSNLNILTSGTNSNGTTTVFELNPKADFGWASVGGRYKIVPYDTGTKPGSEVSISPGEWTNWAIGITPPVGGAIFVGKSLFQHGCGLQYSWNRTQEYLLFESHPVAMPDFLGKLFPRLVRHPVTGPIGACPKKICRTPVSCPPNVPKCQKMTDKKYLEYFPFMDDEDIADCLDAGECVAVDPCDDCPEGTFVVRRELNTGERPIHIIYEGHTAYEETCDNSAYLKIGFGVLPWQRAIVISAPVIPILYPSFWNAFDVNIAERVNLLAYLAWNNDVIDFQVGALYSATHMGPELAPTALIRNGFPTTERYINEGWIYAKYWNGWLKLRTELDWFSRELRFQRSLDGTFFGVPDNIDGSGSLFAPHFVQSLRFMADASVCFGPLMLTAFYSHMPGPDRRHGILIKKQPFINDVAQAGLDPFYPISTLLAYRFGAGANSPGDMTDTSVIAGRIDYAVAANLNVNASFLHATRVSHGYGWGWIRPSQTNFGRVEYLETNAAVQAAIGGRSPFTENIPAIPSRDLGWEVDVGIFWKLLDQFILDLTVSYWQPGKWFNYACVDKSVPGWDVPTAANNWGINPNRTIDPVLGIELGLLASF